MSADRPNTLLEVERLAQGLVTPEEAAAIETRGAAHRDPREGLPDDAEVFADDPADLFVRQVRAAAAEEDVAVSRQRRRRWQVIVPVLAAALALFVLAPDLVAPAPSTADVVLKGGDVQLWVYRDHADGPQRLEDGATVSEGDVLQFAFAAPGMTHGVLLSIDGRGVVTEHHRFAGTRLQAQRLTVPHAYRLDDAPRFEDVVLVVAPRPLDLQAVKEALRKGTLRAPEEGRLLTLRLRKDRR